MALHSRDIEVWLKPVPFAFAPIAPNIDAKIQGSDSIARLVARTIEAYLKDALIANLPANNHIGIIGGETTMVSISRFRGDTAPDKLTVKDSLGVVVDISGYVFTLTVNRVKDPASVAGQMMQLSGTVTDGPAGRVEFKPTADQANVLPGRYFYDIQMVDTGAAITTILTGSYTFRQDITK